MGTWEEYKDYVHEVDPDAATDMDEAAEVANIVSAILKQRHALGLSQRDLSAKCGITQSTVARLESYKSTPDLGTLLKIFKCLGLKLSVTTKEQATVSIKLTKEEKRLAERYAELHSMSVEEAFKAAVFEKIEDEYDAAVGEEAYAEYVESGKKSSPASELWTECGL